MKRIEDFIQYKCAQWLRDNNILHCHVPNGLKSNPRDVARFKAMGLVAGVHDLLLFFRPAKLVLVELKTDDGRLNPAQVRWHANIAKKEFPRHIIQSSDWQESVRQLAEIVAPYLAAEKSRSL